MQREDFKPGQTVYLLETRFMPYEYRVIEKRIKETKVLAVGRKYITVEHYGIKFDIANDFREVTKYTVSVKLYLSKEDIKKEFKRKKMEERIQTAFHFPNYLTRKMTDEELEMIISIIQKYRC